MKGESVPPMKAAHTAFRSDYKAKSAGVPEDSLFRSLFSEDSFTMATSEDIGRYWKILELPIIPHRIQSYAKKICQHLGSIDGKHVDPWILRVGKS